MKKTFICACALLTMTAAAKTTEFTGTGAWDATARWSNGVPVSGDTATVSGTSTVTADGLDVTYYTLNLGKNASDNTVYRQKGGLTVTGAFTLDPTNAPTLTVSGPVAIGAGATITVTDPNLLDKKTAYRLYTATASSGVPELVGFPRGWMASNNGTTLRVSYASGTTILFR